MKMQSSNEKIYYATTASFFFQLVENTEWTKTLLW